MFRCDLDVRALVERGHRQGLQLTWLDTGYLVHAALDGTFGKGAVRPFVVDEAFARKVRVLGYSEVSGDELRAHANTFADPSDHQAWRWESFASKPMPTAFREGQKLGFELTVCPVVRSGGSSRYKKGAEVDAFLARCAEVGEDRHVDRGAVYREWLVARLEARGARPVQLELSRHERVQMLRRTQGAERKGKKLERPLATFKGDLVVRAPDQFAQAIARGVGRHRAFGFGMLLLRPAGLGG
jgi:CRISPR system Cascade subunit CasE